MYRHCGRAAFLLIIIVIVFYTFNSSVGLRLPSQLRLAPSHLASSVKWQWSGHGEPEKYLEVPPATTQHPIEILAEEAQARFSRQLERQSKSLKQATAEYKRRYGRAPPPGFETWYDMAVKNQVSIIDDYDVIMDGLGPFWGLHVPDIRQRLHAVIESKDWLVVYEIKDHQLVAPTETDFKSEQVANWIKEFAEYLPDMQIPYNILAEPRIVLPYEDQQHEAVSCQEETPMGGGKKHADRKFEFLSLGRLRSWGYAIKSCAPSSPARANEDELSNNEHFQALPHPSNTTALAPPTLRFINNAPAVKDICLNPSVQAQHGTLVSPDTMLFSQSLLPIFSRNKFSSFSDVLVPTPFYAQFPPNDEGDVSWDKKVNDLYWAGTTTGGYHHEGSWKFTQRFRFVSLLNDGSRPITLLRQLPSKAMETYQATVKQISERLDAKFTKQKLCAEDDCAAQKADPTLRWGDPDSPTAYKSHRLVIDIDGQGSTDRFYKLLASGSTVLKQTLCEEWHDERLVPWVHYVPISMHMEELPEVIRWLTEEESGRELAKKIADGGRAWWRQGLRNVDMNLYMFRLLLEWARVVDEKRDEGLPVCTETGSWVEPVKPDG